MLLINPAGLPGLQGNLTFDSEYVQDGARDLGRMLDQFTEDAGSASGGAFIQGELEKPDFNLREPLMNISWPKDIVVKTGGGYVDFTSNFFVDYSTTGANEFGLMGGETNALPTIQTNVTKDQFKVNTFGYLIKVPFLDEQRMSQAGRSLQDLLQKGLRVNYDKMLDWNVYFGMTSLGQYGLLNNPSVPVSVAPSGASSGTVGATLSRRWANKTPVEILADMNGLLLSTYVASEYDEDGIANHLLLPPTCFTQISTTPAFAIGGDTILEYFLKNNIAKELGRNVVVRPCRQCNAAGQAVVSGTSSSGRAMAYVNNEDKVHFDETVPLTRVMTQPSAEHVSYLSAYIAKVGQVKFLYYQCTAYLDGIS